jgi:predicted N-acetyltransferase YhbS
MRLTFSTATPADARELAALHTAAADDLTARFGRGFWSMRTSEKGSLLHIRNERVVVARRGNRIVGTLNLPTKKPWAINISYFTSAKNPLYLTGMAVLPEMQRQGVGRSLLKEASKQARVLGMDAIRLDAFDGPAGAGPFYSKCGFTELAHVVYRKDPLIYYELVLDSRRSRTKTV